MSLGVDDTAIAATISLEDAALQPWDVVVAGAGPAGSLVARALAAEGATVLLVDKAAFPREKVCGSCLNGAALAALNAAGLADLPQRFGAISLRNHAASRRADTRQIWPCPAAYHSPAVRWMRPWCVQPSTAALPSLPSTDATLEPTVGEFREVRLRSAGQGVKVNARIAVAADGLSGSFLKETPGMEPIVAPGAPLGAGAVVDGSSDFYEPGTIYMACTRDGYVGAVRLEDGRLDVASAMDQSRMRSLGGAVAAVGQILRAAGFPGLPTGALFRGTPLLTRHRPRVAAQGLFVVGDAAGYLEPFTGEGISWAMQQALLLVPIVREAISGPTSQHAEVWQLQCKRFFRQQRRCCQAAIWMRRNFNLGTLDRCFARPVSGPGFSVGASGQYAMFGYPAEVPPMSMTILGLATAEPAQSIEQSDAARIARTFLSDGREARLLPALFQRTQVRSRGSVLLESGNGCGPRQSFYPPATGPADRGPATALRMQRYAEESLPLAEAAAARSLELATVRPEAITHLITVSCTGFFAPGLDIGLVKRLGLSPTVGRLHVGFMGCHGVLNAMQAAKGHGACRSGGGCASLGRGALQPALPIRRRLRHARGQCPVCRRRRCAGWPGLCRPGRPMAVGFQRLVPSAGLRRRNDLEDRRPRF